MDAVVVLLPHVATGQVRLLDVRVAAVALRARGLEVRVVGRRRGILRALDVVGAVAVGARGGEGLAVRPRLAVDRAAVLGDRLFVAARAIDRLQLARMHGLGVGGIDVAHHAGQLHLAVDRGLVRRGIDADQLALVVLGRLVGVAHQAGVVAGRRRGQELAAREGAGHHEDEEEQAANGNRHGVPCTSTKIAGVFREPLRKCRAIRCRGSHIPRCDRLTQVNLTHAARPGSVGQTPEQPYDAYGNRMRPNGVSPADRSALAGRGHDDAVRFDDAQLRRSTRRRTRRLCLRPPREASGIRFIPPAARAPRAGRRTTRSSFRWQD